MDLVPIFVTAIVFITIYKIIAVLSRRKERLIIADKLENLSNLNTSSLPDNCEELLNAGRKYTSLRRGSVLLGMGMGLFVGFIVQCCVFGLDPSYQYNALLTVLYMGTMLLFGGLALICSFIIERKMENNK